MSNLVVFVRIGDIFQTLNIQGLSLYGIFALFLRVLCLAAFRGILRFLHFLAILCAFLAHSAPPLLPPGVFLPCIFGGLSLIYRSMLSIIVATYLEFESANTTYLEF